MAESETTKVMKNPPCQFCKDRHFACHDRCEKYKAWKQQQTKINEAWREYDRDWHENIKRLLTG